MDEEKNPTTPKRRTWLHWLRITAACFCLVLCVGFVGIWVHSYFSYDQLSGGVSDSTHVYMISCLGRVVFAWEARLTADEISMRNGGKWFLQSIPINEMNKKGHNLHNQAMIGILGFHASQPKQDLWVYRFPHWFLGFAICGIAILFKPWQPRWRFSLRELLLLTTIVAVVLGALAVLWRIGS